MPLPFPFRPSYPFYLGGGAIPPAGPSETGGIDRCIPNTVTLDGYTFGVELNHSEGGWRSGAQDTFRDTIVANDEPNDSLFNARGAWARYKFSWHHGRGQSLADLDQTADTFRFRSSYGLAWDTKYQLKLLKATANNRSVASSNPVMCRSDIYVFMADGATLYRTTDLITWTAMTAPGGTINALTSDGTDLYVTTTTVTVKYVGSATVSTAFGTPPGAGDNIAFCSNRLLLATGNVLKELAGTGATLSTIKTHFQAAFRWTTIFNIGSRIYVGGFAGSRSELHTCTTDSAGTLVQSQEAAPLPSGELLRTGVSYAGAAILCTSNGLRVADVSGDGTLTYGPLMDELGDVRCAYADGRYVFAGFSSMAGSRSGVARLVMDDEVQTLQPAYGNDIFESSTPGVVMGVARLGGLTTFSVAAVGAFVEQTTYTTQGELDSGLLAFGTVEPKGLIGLDCKFSPLGTGEGIEMRVYDREGTLMAVGNASTVAQESLSIDLEGSQVTSFEVRIILTSNGTSTPTFYRWRVRGYPVPPPVLQWVLPLIAHERDVVGAGEGIDSSMNIEEVHLWIEDLWASRRYCVFRVGARAYRVRCDNFEWRPRKWTGEGGGPQGLLVVQLIAA
jgi:hypothetical protein